MLYKRSSPIPLTGPRMFTDENMSSLKEQAGSTGKSLALHAGVGLGVHVGVNAGIKHFAESEAGKTFATNLAALGAQHGMEGRVMNPLLSHALKTVVSPEIMSEYTMAHGLASKAGNKGIPKWALRMGLNKVKGDIKANPIASSVADNIGTSFKEAPHSPLHNVTQGMQDFMKSKDRPTGFMGKAFNFLDKHTITKAEAASTKYKVMSSVARGATLAGGAALSMAGVPVLGEHAVINSARSIIAKTDFGYNVTRKRLLEGASGAPESKLKRFLLDHLVSPGVGATHDMGRVFSKVPNSILGRIIARR